MKLLDSAAQVFMSRRQRSEIPRHSEVTELPLWLNVLFNGWGRYDIFQRNSFSLRESQERDGRSFILNEPVCIYIFGLWLLLQQPAFEFPSFF